MLISSLPDPTSRLTGSRPYFNHSVEFKRPTTAKERTSLLESVGLNVFFFPSEYISGCDLLSDSGTTSMTNRQWAALHEGDEAYGSNRGYFLLRSRIAEVFGEAFAPKDTNAPPTVFLFHQGRAAEHALFTQIGRLGTHRIIPSNGHFDTTQANIEDNRMEARNLFSPALKNPTDASLFKGNMNLPALEQLLKTDRHRIPLIYLTITNNTGGGQPVSLANIKAVSDAAHDYHIPFFLDACRFAENAWFIREHEDPYAHWSISRIVSEIFSCADGFTISFKKDGLANMGGALILRSDGLFIERYPEFSDLITNHQILTEGHPTYGGMSGRDIMALAEGLATVTRDDYLTHRIRQVQRFADRLSTAGIPVVAPAGGHAVYIDSTKFFEGTGRGDADYMGISLTAVLLAAFGHRGCELGNFAFGKYDAKTGKELFPEVNFVRFAVPRLRYEEADLAAVAEAISILYRQRDKLPAVRVVYGRDLPLRHFKARFVFQE